MKKRNLIAVILVAAMCLTLTACTSLGENTRIYFSTTSAVWRNLFSAGKTAPAAAEAAETVEDTRTPLDAPAEFFVDAEGNYSFSGVDDAEYYLLYFCAPDATSDEDTFIYSSEPIPADGSAVYTGRCADKFQYAFGEYLAKVYAFPDLTDAARTMSAAATASYTYTGAQSAPEISYFWNTFDGTMGVQVANMGTYQFEAYPDRVDVTFTNVADSADTLTVAIEGVAPGNVAVSTDALTRGAAYAITAVATSESPYVTNPTSDVTTVEPALTLGEDNLYTGYTYSDGFANNIFCWPIVGNDFDLVNGGVAGQSTVFFGPTNFNVTPVTARDGSLYSYDLSTSSMMPLLGTLELRADGTFQLSETGDGPVNASTIDGRWSVGEDGLATLSYDHSSIVMY